MKSASSFRASAVLFSLVAAIFFVGALLAAPSKNFSSFVLAAPLPQSPRASTTLTPPSAPSISARKNKSTSARSQKSAPPTASQTSASQPDSDLPESAVTSLARDLRDHDSKLALTRLSNFASSAPRTPLKARAALALGYYEYTKDHFPQAGSWLALAEADTVLREYTRFWRAMTDEKLAHRDEAIKRLEAFRKDFPDSILTEQAVHTLADLSLAAGQPKKALAALDSYNKVWSRPNLLLLRARARESAGRARDSVGDYLALYYDYPTSDEATAAGQRISALRKSLPPDLFAVSQEKQLERAAAFYSASKWREALAEYEKIRPRLTEVAADRAALRIAQCRARLTKSVAPLAKLAITHAELDAERLYALSQQHRTLEQEQHMLDTIEQLVAKYPQSRWADEALFSTGNYFWVNLDRPRAATYYQRVLDNFPAGRNIQNSHWRVAWAAYLERKPEAAALFEDHIRRFPASQYVENALYWLGRSAERAENPAAARGYFSRLTERFPQTYFGREAAARLATLGVGASQDAPVLALVRAPRPLPQLDAAIPPAVTARYERALALRSIAFDAGAELEFRAAHAQTAAPRLLWEAARSAADARRFSPAIASARLLHPQLESRLWDEVAVEVWRTVYPLDYEESLQKHAAARGLDPALVAGLIRQESVWQPDAISRAGALGLMQVLPSTGRTLARQEKIPYSRKKLFEPEYNLRLGTLYLSIRLQELGSWEAALAAYNAGAHRVVKWQAERKFDEPAEFVESIPFTETREYVQIVTRNAEIYRRLFQHAPLKSAVAASSHHTQ